MWRATRIIFFLIVRYECVRVSAVYSMFVIERGNLVCEIRVFSPKNNSKSLYRLEFFYCIVNHLRYPDEIAFDTINGYFNPTLNFIIDTRFGKLSSIRVIIGVIFCNILHVWIISPLFFGFSVKSTNHIRLLVFCCFIAKFQLISLLS